ncbi:glycosyltransferase family protein [Propionivibrio sp.]|uniref:glycosyltransferase family protein n=1 Tax=Propionivibrio sp. TaxID=2212460 RepID=UPI003BF02EB9
MMSSDVHQLAKPKLLFFRPKYGRAIPTFLVTHRDEHAQCLSQFFDLKIIEEDCDCREACDRHEPVACLFEIGLQRGDARQPRIVNVERMNDVPKIALINADVWGYTRSRILAEVQAFDFDAVFAICTTAGEHFEELRDRLYYWPNFIDEDTFQIRQQNKTEILFLTGNMGDEYPWRKRIRNSLLHAFPVKQSYHAGYYGRQLTSRMPIGINYASLIGAAWFAPTCGTMANELVRKHLEIPSVGSCLITERSATLDVAGFSDMRNVVFADEHDVVDKVNYLMHNVDTLRCIIKNGHDLVHTMHTMRARSQIYDWLSLYRQAPPGARIVQPNPFARLVLQQKDQQDLQTLHVEGGGRYLRLLSEAGSHINAGRLELAIPLIEECKRIAPCMPDIDFFEAYCNLQGGKPAQALQDLVRMLKASLGSSETTPPDPIEWAYLIVALLAMGRTRTAFRYARQFLEVSHPELDKARAAAFLLQKSVPLAFQSKKVVSIHRLQDKPLTAWMNSLAIMLERSGQPSAALRLISFPWNSVRSDADLYDFMHRSGYAPRHVPPLVSGRLRRWDSPLVVAAILRRVRHLLPTMPRLVPRKELNLS